VLELAYAGGGEGVLPLRFETGSQLHRPPRTVEALAATVREADDPSVAFRRGGFLGPVESPLPRDPRAPRCSLLLREEMSYGLSDAAASRFFCNLFRAIADKEALELTRFDLFHAHLLALWDTGQLGALFHAREYPASIDEGGHFPFDLGFCHHGSTCLKYVDADSAATSMARRNILWIFRTDGQPLAFVLDTSLEGLTCDLDVYRSTREDRGSPVPRNLVRPYHLEAHTILESDLGTPMADLYFFEGELRVCTRP